MLRRYRRQSQTGIWSHWQIYYDILVVFITMDKETMSVKKKEDFLKQNPDMIFGDDLMVAVANVDTGTLKKIEEDMALGEGESRIIFQSNQDGSIGIIEIKE